MAQNSKEPQNKGGVEREKTDRMILDFCVKRKEFMLLRRNNTR